MLLRLEQKSVEWLTDLVFKLCDAVEPVLNTCDGKFATAKARLQLPERRGDIGCETNTSCSKDAIPSQVEVYAKQVLSANSVITGSDEVV